MTLDQKLKKKLEEKQSLLIIQNHLKQLSKRISDAYLKKDNLAWWVEKEYADIKKLEKMTTKGLFIEILIDKEEQLEIERQEYLEALLEHRDVVKSIELLKFEKKVLEEKLTALPQVEKELNDLILLREQEIMRNGEPKRTQLVRINNQIDNCIQQKREVYEAKIAGAKVKQIIEQIITRLRIASEAEPWGFKETWDPVPETPDYISKSKLESVLNLFLNLKVQLQNFEEELNDIYNHKKLKISGEIIDVTHLAKEFYHNLISDWVIRQKVYNVIFQMESIFDRINRVCQSLVVEERQLDEKILTLEEKVVSIITD